MQAQKVPNVIAGSAIITFLKVVIATFRNAKMALLEITIAFGSFWTLQSREILFTGKSTKESGWAL